MCARGVGTGLLTALLAGAAGPPPTDASWIEISPSRPEVVVFRSGSYSDALVRLALVNHSDRLVRVKDVRITYLKGDQVLDTEAPGPRFFTRDRVERPDRIERGAETDWPGICLSHLPEGAERVRFDLDLAIRRGLGQVHSHGRVDVALRHAPPPRILTLPFRGFWRVTQGHTCRTNHRLGGYGVDFAWDFVALDPRSGSSVDEVYSITRRNRDTVTFGRPVLSPAEGKVVRVVDDVPDNEGLHEYPRKSLLEDLGRPLWIFGNFVVLDLGEGQYLLLAHLKEASILVQPGDRVRVGDPIAAAGNSGNSIEPHLHVQVMDRADPADPGVTGLPGLFHDYVEITSQVREDHRDTSVRHAETGDPPEGAVVAAAAAELRGGAEPPVGSATEKAGKLLPGLL